MGFRSQCSVFFTQHSLSNKYILGNFSVSDALEVNPWPLLSLLVGVRHKIQILIPWIKWYNITALQILLIAATGWDFRDHLADHFIDLVYLFTSSSQLRLKCVRLTIHSGEISSSQKSIFGLLLFTPGLKISPSQVVTLLYLWLGTQGTSQHLQEPYKGKLCEHPSRWRGSLPRLWLLWGLYRSFMRP